MTSGIHIGASVQAVKEAREAILAILDRNVAEAVQIVALKTLRTICEVKNTTISGCTIYAAKETDNGS